MIGAFLRDLWNALLECGGETIVVAGGEPINLEECDDPEFAANLYWMSWWWL